MRKLSLTEEEREQLFHSELVKSGVPFQKAQRAAKLILTNQPKEALNEEEKALLEEVCRTWMKQRERYQSITGTLKLLNP